MEQYCKYCDETLADLTDEALECRKCSKFVHLRCLKRGSTPGALPGDVFFEFTCLECSSAGAEIFSRNGQRCQSKQQDALSRRGLYQWRMHIGGFIEKHWKILFPPSVNQKKNWLGSISGQLSIYSHSFFRRSGLPKMSGWWALTFPNLTPNVTIKLANELNAKKALNRSQGITCPDMEILEEILESKAFPSEYVSRSAERFTHSDIHFLRNLPVHPVRPRKRKWTKALISPFTKKDKVLRRDPALKKKRVNPSSSLPNICISKPTISSEESKPSTEGLFQTKFLDPMCHYNTSLNLTQMISRMNLKSKLMGDLREEPILSPYSNLYLKPYIRRDSSRAMPDWLKLMAELQLQVNATSDSETQNKAYRLPPRGPIDYVYVQPAHIPAVNSLCNQFFWPGIDLTDCLQYPDFTCVAMYRKLVIGFAVLVPNVSVHENYISFLFVRPGWRNVGIGKFMLYHLIQTSMGKDITLHVAMNNPALLLYQKFGFKVEHVEVNFYDKYLQTDSFESKHAFFCRLER